MAGETHDQTQPTAKEETRKTDQNITLELKKLQIQFQDAFRRYRDIIGRAVCDDHDRRITNIQILLVIKEIKQINCKQRALVKRWRGTREARRIEVRLSRRRRLESDVDERFDFHFSPRFRRHWELALDRMRVVDKAETLRLKSLALLGILPKTLDKELRQMDKDDPPVPCPTDLIKALGQDKAAQNGRKRGASRRGGSAGGSGEEGRPFKAPRCSKRIRGVSPSMEADLVDSSLSVNGSASRAESLSVVADSNGADGHARAHSDKVSDGAGSDPTSPSSTQQQQQQQRLPNGARPQEVPEVASSDRKTQSLDLRVGGSGSGERRHFCCAFCHDIRRITASLWCTDGVLWCRRCRPSSGASSAADSNTGKSAASCPPPQRPDLAAPAGAAAQVNGGDDRSGHSASSMSSTAAMR